MSDVVIYKDEHGKLTGFGEKGQRAWNRFTAATKKMNPGDTLHFSWKLPRSGPHHRLFFAMLGSLMDRQEQFDDVDDLRGWLQVGAGHCSFVPGPNGRMCALPKSIAYDKMDEVEFGEFHGKVNAFLRTERAQQFLWAHLAPEKASEAAESLLAEFDMEAT